MDKNRYTGRREVVVDGFTYVGYFKDAEAAILWEIEKSEHHSINKHEMMRKYRMFKKQDLERAATNLSNAGKIKIVKAVGGRGRPAIYFRSPQ